VAYLGSTLLANGASHLARIGNNAERWLQERGFASVAEARGRLSQANSDDPAAFARGHYVKMLSTYRPQARPRSISTAYRLLAQHLVQRLQNPVDLGAAAVMNQ
jgi:hypothetical protein